MESEAQPGIFSEINEKYTLALCNEKNGYSGHGIFEPSRLGVTTQPSRIGSATVVAYT